MIRTYISKIDGQYYAFAGDTVNDQVYSIGRDRPPKLSGTGCYFARWSNSGITWVASPSPSRNAAYAKARRHGDYFGEV